MVVGGISMCVWNDGQFDDWISKLFSKWFFLNFRHQSNRECHHHWWQACRKYRFRVIYSAADVCLVQLSIENVVFTITATKHSFIELSLAVVALRFLSGERYDIVIDANLDPGDYWLRALLVWTKLKVRNLARSSWSVDVKWGVKHYELIEWTTPSLRKLSCSIQLMRNSITRRWRKERPLILNKACCLTPKPIEGFIWCLNPPEFNNDIMFDKEKTSKHQFEFSYGTISCFSFSLSYTRSCHIRFHLKLRGNHLTT